MPLQVSSGRHMDFGYLVRYLERLSDPSLQRERAAIILAELFRQAQPEEIASVIGICTNNFRPHSQHQNIMRTSLELLTPVCSSPPTVREVFCAIRRIRQCGEAERHQLTGNLEAVLDDVESAWFYQLTKGAPPTVISEILILEALALAKSSHLAGRKALENAYFARANLTYIAHRLWSDGPDSLVYLPPKPGIPIYPEAQIRRRPSNLDEIWDSFGPCYVHTKYDGYRCQIHKQDSQIWIFLGRNVKDWTTKLPNVVAAAARQIIARNAIIESELVPVDPETGVFIPRTHFNKTYYHAAVVWDVLYCDGEDLRDQTYAERLAVKETVIRSEGGAQRFQVSNDVYVTSRDELQEQYVECRRQGEEGIIIIRPEAKYVFGLGGKRSPDRIKLKAVDPVDAVIVGYDLPQGNIVEGSAIYHLAVYDKLIDSYVVFGKSSSGLTKEANRKLFGLCEPLGVAHHPRVISLANVDHIIPPKIVVEVEVDHIFPSDEYPCGLSRGQQGFGGQHIRFTTDSGRDDKEPHQATTVDEFLQIRREPSSHYLVPASSAVGSPSPREACPPSQLPLF